MIAITTRSSISVKNASGEAYDAEINSVSDGSGAVENQIESPVAFLEQNPSSVGHY